MDCSPPGSSVHGVLQARILEWVASPSPGDLPHPVIEHGSPALQADSLPFAPLGKPHQGSNPQPLHWKRGVLTTDHQGKALFLRLREQLGNFRLVPVGLMSLATKSCSSRRVTDRQRSAQLSTTILQAQGEVPSIESSIN